MVENYLEVLYDSKPLSSSRLILRNFTKEDASDVLEYASDPRVTEYLQWSGVKTLEETRKIIVETYWSNPAFFAITLKCTGKCIGAIDIRIKKAHDKASIGYVLGREHWGKGYMTEVLSAIINVCFDKLELNRVEASHFTGNEASGRVMAKCGMQLEGVGIQQEKVKGIFRDNVFYGITKEQWMSINN